MMLDFLLEVLFEVSFLIQISSSAFKRSFIDKIGIQPHASIPS
jgi:hypothetical protein